MCRALTDHVIHTHLGPSFIELHGILPDPTAFAVEARAAAREGQELWSVVHNRRRLPLRLLPFPIRTPRRPPRRLGCRVRQRLL